MTKELDISTWSRKEHFEFFKSFEEPFFGLTVEVDCTKAYAYCKRNELSFFLYYLHASLKAANMIEEFKYRILGEKVLIHDHIDASPTINRDDGTFGFSYIQYCEDFNDFVVGAQLEIDRVRNGSGLIPAVSGENVIHYSSLPWLKFTSLSHARSFTFHDSCPKVSFGKMTESNNSLSMPVSVHVHHALLDGLHVGIFIKNFENLMNEK